VLAIKENELPAHVTQSGAAQCVMEAVDQVLRKVRAALDLGEWSNREKRMLEVASEELSQLRGRFEEHLLVGNVELVANPRAE